MIGSRVWPSLWRSPNRNPVCAQFAIAVAQCPPIWLSGCPLAMSDAKIWRFGALIEVLSKHVSSSTATASAHTPFPICPVRDTTFGPIAHWSDAKPDLMSTKLYFLFVCLCRVIQVHSNQDICIYNWRDCRPHPLAAEAAVARAETGSTFCGGVGDPCCGSLAGLVWARRMEHLACFGPQAQRSQTTLRRPANASRYGRVEDRD